MILFILLPMLFFRCQVIKAAVWLVRPCFCEWRSWPCDEILSVTSFGVPPFSMSE